MKRYLNLLALLLLVACTISQTQGNSTNTPEPVITQLVEPTDSLPATTYVAVESPSSTPTAHPFTLTSTPNIIATETPLADNSIETPFTTGFLVFFWDTETPLEEPTAWSIPAGEPKQDLYVAIPGSNPNTWQVHSLLRHRLDWPNQAPNWPAVNISSDKTKIAFQVQRFSDFGQSAYSNSIYVYSWVEGTIKEVVSETALEIFGIGWMPDNHTLTYVQENELYQVDVLANVSPQPLTNPFTAKLSWFAWSPKQEIVALLFPSSSEKLMLFNKADNTLTPVLINEQPGLPSTMAWSPTGEWLASNLGGDIGLFLYNPDLTRSVTLVDSGFSAHTWSYDGSKLAFTQINNLDFSLAIWDAHTEETNTLVADQGSSLSKPIWSPDNQNIFIGQFLEGMVQLSIVEVSTNAHRDILQLSDIYDFTSLGWSPDGQWLLFYTAKNDNSAGLYIVDVYGNNMERVLDTTNTLKPYQITWIFESTLKLPQE